MARPAEISSRTEALKRLTGRVPRGQLQDESGTRAYEPRS
jgi:hypothetical protein